MTFSPGSRSGARALRLVFATLFVLAATSARADEVGDIGKLLRAGQNDQALQKVDAYLATKPKDAQGRFLKGLILTEQNKTADAIGIFSKLTEDYPELPEPYNNLAVLYAGQGQYEKARQALEMAIRTHPSYATAHENLGDVYAKLASQAYDKALSLDSSNATAQTKLAMVKELIGSGNRARTGGTQTAAVKPLPGSSTAPAPASTPPGKDAKGAAPAAARRLLPLPPRPRRPRAAATNRRWPPPSTPGPRPGPSATCPATWPRTARISRRPRANRAPAGRPGASSASKAPRASTSRCRT